MDFVKEFSKSKLFDYTPEEIEECKNNHRIAFRKSRFAKLKKRMKSRRKRKQYYNENR